MPLIHSQIEGCKANYYVPEPVLTLEVGIWLGFGVEEEYGAGRSELARVGKSGRASGEDLLFLTLVEVPREHQGPLRTDWEPISKATTPLFRQ
jgi:hypothetical protein